MIRLLAAVLALFALTVAASAAVTPYPAGFQTQMIETNGTSLYVRVGGQGPAVVLLHGFGDTGDMWAPIAAELMKDHTVIVPDLRGMGLSAHPDTRLHQEEPGRRHCRRARRAEDREGRSRHPRYRQHGRLCAWPRSIRDRITRWVVIDAPLPGIGDWDNIIRSPLLWHFNFRGPDMERLVAGRERIYLDRFWNELSANPEGDRRSDARALCRALRATACHA